MLSVKYYHTCDFCRKLTMPEEEHKNISHGNIPPPRSDFLVGYKMACQDCANIAYKTLQAPLTPTTED